MATKPKALIDFTRMKDDELMLTASTIVGAMTDNVNFTAPTPALEEIQGLLDDYSARIITLRLGGSTTDTSEKNDSKNALADGLQKLAYYVNSTAQGQLSKVLSSGFPIPGATVLSTVPGIAEGISLADGRQSGQIRLDFARQSKVSIYEYCYRKISTPEEPWSDRYSTTSSRNNVIAPVIAGQRYEVRVRAVNSRGAGDWSQPVSIMAR